MPQLPEPEDQSLPHFWGLILTRVTPADHLPLSHTLPCILWCHIYPSISVSNFRCLQVLIISLCDWWLGDISNKVNVGCLIDLKLPSQENLNVATQIVILSNQITKYLDYCFKVIVKVIKKNVYLEDRITVLWKTDAEAT